MARDGSGRFQAGESGNPGGRPGSVMSHTLSGRPAARALAGLLGLLGPGVTVVLVDARGLVLPTAGRRRPAGEAEADPPAFACDRPPDPDAAARRVAARAAAIAALGAAWEEVSEDRPVADSCGAVSHVVRFRHRERGEVIGFGAWCRLIDQLAAGIEAAPGEAVALPEPGQDRHAGGAGLGQHVGGAGAAGEGDDEGGV